MKRFTARRQFFKRGPRKSFTNLKPPHWQQSRPKSHHLVINQSRWHWPAWRLPTIHFPRWKFRKIHLLPVLITTIFLVSLFFLYRYQQTTVINCEANGSPCPAALQNWLNTKQTSSVFINLITLRHQLITTFPQVSQATVALSGPHTLQLHLQLDIPIASITTQRLMAESIYFLTAGTGRLIGIVSQPYQPVVILQNLTTPLRQTLPAPQLTAVLLARQLSLNRYQFTAQQTDFSTLTVTFLDQSTVLFPLTESQSPQSLVNALQLILSEATIDASHQLDLRYQPPIIRDLRVILTPTPESSASAKPDP